MSWDAGCSRAHGRVAVPCPLPVRAPGSCHSVVNRPVLSPYPICCNGPETFGKCDPPFCHVSLTNSCSPTLTVALMVTGPHSTWHAQCPLTLPAPPSPERKEETARTPPAPRGALARPQRAAPHSHTHTYTHLPQGVLSPVGKRLGFQFGGSAGKPGQFSSQLIVGSGGGVSLPCLGVHPESCHRADSYLSESG